MSDSSYCKVQVGLYKIIGRWAQDSVITYNVDSASFPTPETLDHTLSALGWATEEWNGVCKAYVRFERVANDSPAVFQLRYETKDKNTNSSTLAQAFYPSPQSKHSQQRALTVYSLCFKPEHYGHMRNVFLHELGHILGLRHEFAGEVEKDKPVRLGSVDPCSVMNYFDDWGQCRITEYDRDGLKELYELKGSEYKGFQIRTIEPKCNPDTATPGGIFGLIQSVIGMTLDGSSKDGEVGWSMALQ